MAHNCLVNKLKSSVQNNNLRTLNAVTIFKDGENIDFMRMLSKGNNTIVKTEGNYLSLSADGSNPVNNVPLSISVETVIYALPGKYNIVIENVDKLNKLHMFPKVKENTRIYGSDVVYLQGFEQFLMSKSDVYININDFYSCLFITGISLQSTGLMTRGSVEQLCKNIIEKTPNRTATSLTVTGTADTDLYILNDVKFPGTRTVNCVFDFSNHSFTLTESASGLNRTFTLSGGTWSYVDN